MEGIISVSILIIILLLIPICFIEWRKHTSNVIEFVSKSYFIRNVIKKSNYFDKFNNLDLIARHTSSIEDYKALLKDSLVEFTHDDKNHLKELVENINIHLAQFSKIESIPWKIIKVKKNIENGYPHTLEDVIILSELFFTYSYEKQMLTLLHEKIHIFQRIYPIETQEFVMNVIKFQIKKKDVKFNDLIRHNPDIIDITYGMENFYILQLYNNDNPSDIGDSKAFKINEETLEVLSIVTSDLHLPNDITQLEHPYEIMASYLPFVILHRMPNSLMSKEVISWLLRHAV